jgi:4-amino-4-deoxy-L-arabinose transferase-like glycosyltransferase
MPRISSPREVAGMIDAPRFGLNDLLCLLLVVACAAGTRAWYVAACTDNGSAEPALHVQEPATRGARANLAALVQNVYEESRFTSRAPLSDRDEPTAHLAPAYPWVIAQLTHLKVPTEASVRWLQVGLGTLTVLCYFLFARRAFYSTRVATIAGLLAAFYPFWIVNTGEVADGPLAACALAVCLALGGRASQAGGTVTCLAFGLSLAGLALVRAAFLPFTLVAFLWFLWHCRTVRWGWFAGLLAFLGYANGLAPWAIRNWQQFGEPLPVVSSAYLDLWVGNNPHATGSTLTEEQMRDALPDALRDDVLQEPNQAHRYAKLGPLVWDEVAEHPDRTFARRIDAGLMFLFGESWFRDRTLADRAGEGQGAAAPDWLADNSAAILAGSLLVLLVLAFLGWRWTFDWSFRAALAAIAVVWVPVPYVLGHAEYLSGPRLPLDGVLLCYAAFALAYCTPGFAWTPAQLDLDPDDDPARAKNFLPK